jgi:hypothetical protein
VVASGSAGGSDSGSWLSYCGGQWQWLVDVIVARCGGSVKDGDDVW